MVWNYALLVVRQRVHCYILFRGPADFHKSSRANILRCMLQVSTKLPLGRGRALQNSHRHHHLVPKLRLGTHCPAAPRPPTALSTSVLNCRLGFQLDCLLWIGVAVALPPAGWDASCTSACRCRLGRQSHFCLQVQVGVAVALPPHSGMAAKLVNEFSIFQFKTLLSPQFRSGRHATEFHSRISANRRGESV